MPCPMPVLVEVVETNCNSLTYHKNIARITECAAPASDDRTFDFITNHGQSLMIDPYMGLSHNLIALLRRAMGLSDRDFDARTGTWLKDEINIMYVLRLSQTCDSFTNGIQFID